MRTSSLQHHHQRRNRGTLNTSLNPSCDENIGTDKASSANVGNLCREELHWHLCSTTPLTQTCIPSAPHIMDFNFFGWNDIVQNRLLSIVSATIIGMHPLPACARDYNIMSGLNNYQSGAVAITPSRGSTIQSSSLLSSSSSSGMRVKIDDTINYNPPYSSSTKQLSMGVKMEYYPEEITEMKRQAEREQQQLLLEQKMAEDKAAAAAVAAKIVEQPPQQQQVPTTLPSVQVVDQSTQQRQSKINTEEEEYVKMLSETSTTSAVKTKPALSAVSQVAVKPINDDDDDVKANEANNEKLFQVIGVGAVGAGWINLIISKRGNDRYDIDGVCEDSILVRTPTPPPELGLDQVLGFLENDLEVLENDIYELNGDIDLLQDQGKNLPSADVTFAATGSTGSYLDSLSSSKKKQFDSNRPGMGFQSSYLGGLGGAAPLEYDYKDIEEVSPPSFPSSASYTTSLTANSQRKTHPVRSSTRLPMFGVNHPRRGRHSTRLYLSHPSDYEEEESMFPSTDALIEVLRRKKMEKDRRDAELRSRQQAEQEAKEAAVSKARREEQERFLAEERASFIALKMKREEEERLADEQRAREEAEKRAREEEERLLAEQRAQEEAALRMQLQMRIMAAEKKAQEEAMIMEEKAKEEEMEKLRQQNEEAERSAAEQRRQREEAILKAWEDEEERLLQEEKAKEEAEMKLFEERLAAEQRAKEEQERLLSLERAKEEIVEKFKHQHEQEHWAAVERAKKEVMMKLKQEKEELLQIDQNMSYLNDALAQVDDRLDALNNYIYDAEEDYIDIIDDGIQYLTSALSEIDSLLSEDDGY